MNTYEAIHPPHDIVKQYRKGLTAVVDRCVYIYAYLILPLYHKSGLLGLYATLTVSDLFFVFFVEFYGVF